MEAKIDKLDDSIVSLREALMTLAVNTSHD
jgi:hypothetical protein